MIIYKYILNYLFEVERLFILTVIDILKNDVLFGLLRMNSLGVSKVNVADFQWKHNGKYKRNIKINSSMYMLMLL